jgi:hypothetical protein
MSVWMRWEQCCEEEGCKRPAHHGALCTPCFMAAPPARRAVELYAGSMDPLEALWLLPAAGT